MQQSINITQNIYYSHKHIYIYNNQKRATKKDLYILFNQTNTA